MMAGKIINYILENWYWILASFVAALSGMIVFLSELLLRMRVEREATMKIKIGKKTVNIDLRGDESDDEIKKEYRKRMENIGKYLDRRTRNGRRKY